MRPRGTPPRTHLANSPFAPQPEPEVHEFAPGDRVTHDRHGLGSILRLTGDRVEIRFGTTTVSVPRNSTRIHPL